MADLTIEQIYPKPEKILLLLQKNKESLIEEAKELVTKDFFNGNVANKDLLVEFLALEIIDVDKNYELSKERLEEFKNIDSIRNNWLKWSLSLNRDIKDINLVNSGITPFTQEELKKFFTHKSNFAKKYNIDLKEENLDMLYYKLYKVLGKEELGTFYKYYDKFKTLGESVLKILYVKDIQSLDQIDFYLEAIREKEKNNLDTRGFNFLLAINYKYIEEFKSQDLNLIKVLNKNLLPSEDYIYKMIEYATNDKDLISLLKAFTKFSPGSFLKTIDPREVIEDQARTSNTEITYQDDKAYIVNENSEYMRLYTPDQALKKLYNEFLDVKLSPKVKFKDDEFKFSLDKLNIPYLNGNFNDYSFETHALLTQDGLLNSGLLVRGIIDKDCSSSFKDNYIMGYECIEGLIAYPEDNVYVVIKDPKNNDIASMYVTRAQDSLIIDSIQYMKNLQGMSNEEVESNFHKSLIPTIYAWATEVCKEDKSLRKIYMGEGYDGLRLTEPIRDQIGLPIRKFNKSHEEKEKNYLIEITTPYAPSMYNDFEDSPKQRLVYTTDPRLLTYKKVKEHVENNISVLPNSEELLNDIKELTKSMKKLNEKREEFGFEDKFNMQQGFCRDEYSLKEKDDYIEEKYSNNSLYDVDL